jgi:hypothetical protein
MSKKTITAIVALAIVMLAPVVNAAEGIVGEWEFKSQIPARTSTATMKITKNAEGKYEGTWSAQWGESVLSDIKFENGKMSFIQMSNFGGQEMKTTYEGAVDGNEIVEKLTITKNADGTLAGKWEAKRGENTISDVKFEASKLMFTRTSKFGDREFTMTFEGTVEGNNIKGVFKGERGEREANATRVTSAKPEESKKSEPNKPQ